MTLLVKPIITENSLSAAKLGYFTFKAPVDSNKYALKKAINLLFGVTVTAIKTLIVKGENKRSQKNRRMVMSSSYKKVIARLKAGQTIAAFDITGS